MTKNAKNTDMFSRREAFLAPFFVRVNVPLGLKSKLCAAATASTNSPSKKHRNAKKNFIFPSFQLLALLIFDMSAGLGGGETGVAKGCSAVQLVLSSPPDIGPDICFPQKMEKKNLGVTNSSSCLVLIGMLASSVSL